MIQNKNHYKKFEGSPAATIWTELLSTINAIDTIEKEQGNQKVCDVIASLQPVLKKISVLLGSLSEGQDPNYEQVSAVMKAAGIQFTFSPLGIKSSLKAGDIQFTFKPFNIKGSPPAQFQDLTLSEKSDEKIDALLEKLFSTIWRNNTIEKFAPFLAPSVPVEIVEHIKTKIDNVLIKKALSLKAMSPEESNAANSQWRYRLKTAIKTQELDLGYDFEAVSGLKFLPKTVDAMALKIRLLPIMAKTHITALTGTVPANTSFYQDLVIKIQQYRRVQELTAEYQKDMITAFDFLTKSMKPGDTKQHAMVKNLGEKINRATTQHHQCVVDLSLHTSKLGESLQQTLEATSNRPESENLGEDIAFFKSILEDIQRCTLVLKLTSEEQTQFFKEIPAQIDSKIQALESERTKSLDPKMYDETLNDIGIAFVINQRRLKFLSEHFPIINHDTSFVSNQMIQDKLVQIAQEKKPFKSRIFSLTSIIKEVLKKISDPTHGKTAAEVENIGPILIEPHLRNWTAGPEEDMRALTETESVALNQKKQHFETLRSFLGEFHLLSTKVEGAARQENSSQTDQAVDFSGLLIHLATEFNELKSKIQAYLNSTPEWTAPQDKNMLEKLVEILQSKRTLHDQWTHVETAHFNQQLQALQQMLSASQPTENQMLSVFSDQSMQAWYQARKDFVALKEQWCEQCPDRSIDAQEEEYRTKLEEHEHRLVQVAALRDSIRKMYQKGIELQTEHRTQEGACFCEIALEVAAKSVAYVKELDVKQNVYCQELSELLSQDSRLRMIQQHLSWGIIVLNIVIACTGVGLLLQIGLYIYSGQILFHTKIEDEAELKELKTRVFKELRQSVIDP